MMSDEAHDEDRRWAAARMGQRHDVSTTHPYRARFRLGSPGHDLRAGAERGRLHNRNTQVDKGWGPELGGGVL